MSPYLRTVKTTSGATAVQIVHSSRRGSRDIEHLGSAHDDAGLELLKAAGRQRIAAGQGELDLGLDPADRGGGGGHRLPRAPCAVELADRLDDPVAPVSYRTVTRRLRAFAKDSWRQQISAACAAHAGLGPASLVLYDVSTLYFGTDAGDGFRDSGFS